MRRRLASWLLCMACLAPSTACIAVHYGKRSDTRALETQLTPRKSTKSDVVQVLGYPRGFGKVRLRPEEQERVTWFYDYGVAQGSSVKQQMLMLYFDGEILDGYFWFGSTEKVGRKPK